MQSRYACAISPDCAKRSTQVCTIFAPPHYFPTAPAEEQSTAASASPSPYSAPSIPPASHPDRTYSPDAFDSLPLQSSTACHIPCKTPAEPPEPPRTSQFRHYQRHMVPSSPRAPIRHRAVQHELDKSRRPEPHIDPAQHLRVPAPAPRLREAKDPSIKIHLLLAVSHQKPHVIDPLRNPRLRQKFPLGLRLDPRRQRLHKLNQRVPAGSLISNTV